MFVSGNASSETTSTLPGGRKAKGNVVLFGGDVVVSGTLFAERQVVEVDSVADGDFFVTGSMF